MADVKDSRGAAWEWWDRPGAGCVSIAPRSPWALAPGLDELRGYRRDQLRPDLLAGITGAAVAVPAGLAMGELAGLSPVAGLYATMLPLVAYALFTSSRQVMVGPDGTLAVLTASTVAPLAGGNAARYAALAAALALMVGLILLLSAALRLGFMADFLSIPILVGYFNGIALIIIASQFGKLFGLSISATYFFGVLREFVTEVGQIHWWTAVFSVALLALVLVLKRFAPAFPGSLLAVVVGRRGVGDPRPARSWGGRRRRHPRRPAVVDRPGRVAARRATARAARRPASRWSRSPTPSPMRGPTPSGTVTRSSRTGNSPRSVRPTSPPASAAPWPSRPAALDRPSTTRPAAHRRWSDSSRRWSSPSVAAVATPLIEPVPIAALGVVVIAAVIGMVDIRRRAGACGGCTRPRSGWRWRPCSASLILGVLGGLLVAIGLSIGVYVYRSIRPHDAILGAVHDVDGYHDIDASPPPTPCRG